MNDTTIIENTTQLVNNFPLYISLLSLVISIITGIYTRKAILENVRLSKLNSNYPQLLEAHKILMQNTSLLELHNVKEDELQSIGVTKEEFIYILISFEAVQSYYEFEGKKKIDPNTFTSYRKSFLRNDKVRGTWKKIIKDRMSVENNFIEAIEKFYRNDEQFQDKKSCKCN